MATGWLVAEVLDKPYPLNRGALVQLGRASDNHVILPVQQVSRYHASIRWADGKFELIDRGSRNGTKVNGELATRRLLADGDVIGIGPIELMFATRLLEVVPRADTGETAHDWGFFMIQSSFAGSLTHVALADVWQMLDLGRKTGRLLVKRGDVQGVVYFENGRPVHAEAGELDGDDAAVSLLLLDQGTFRFQPSSFVIAHRTIQKPPTSLLLEAARIADESLREVA